MSDKPSEGIRPGSRGGDVFTVLLLSIGNFVVPVVSYIWGAVRLAQSSRWNKAQRALLLLIFPALFIVPAVAFLGLRTNTKIQPNQLDRAVTRENAIAKCMRSRGWQYTPSLYPGESEDITRSSGVSKAAQQKRIKVPTADESAGGPPNAATIKQSDRNAYIQSYWGADGTQGCQAVGNAAVGLSDPSIRKMDDNSAKIAKLVTDRQRSDPRLVQESKRYVQCMSGLGYTTVNGWIGPHQLRERIYAEAGTGGPGGGYNPKTPKGKALEAKLAALASADNHCNVEWKEIFNEVTNEALTEARKSDGIN
jgi:hypothetical protein